MKLILKNISKGILIGIGNIIPGLSGSTIALILGVYEKLIMILAKFDVTLIKLIFQLNFKAVRQHISFFFLSSVTIGIIIGVIALAHVLNYLFHYFETYTWSYFLGIMIASIFYVKNYTTKWKKKESMYFLFGLIISITLFFINPNMEENKNLLFVFLCGIIGIIGMLIPGLSGSYLLVLLGNYELLISETLHHLTQPMYYNNKETYIYLKLFITFLLGHIFGILLFSRILKWLLKNYKNATFATLTGFITGSLLWIWPWKNQDIINENSINVFQKLSYPSFNDMADIYAVLLIIIGAITIISLEKLGKKYDNV